MRSIVRVMPWVLLLVICMSPGSAPEAGSAQGSSAPSLDGASIGGTVLNAANGKPEPGVWVIAETKLQTGFRKIVVTNDEGRFLIPDLPAASYELWVRGYGLKDSANTVSALIATCRVSSCLYRSLLGSLIMSADNP